MEKIMPFLKRCQDLLKRCLPFLKRYWPWLAGGLAVCLAAVILILVLGGSAPVAPTLPNGETNATTNGETAGPTGDTVVDPTNGTTVDPNTPVVYRNPLNGMIVEEPWLNRPVAVMLNNIKAAMPQHGVSQADILYEILAEGGITRCMGIYSDISQVEKLGSIRSARKYFIFLAQGYGASYVHAAGGSIERNLLAGKKDMDLDVSKTSKYVYRDQDRLNAGYSLEHTLFTSGENLLAFAEKQNVATMLKKPANSNMQFAEQSNISGQAVNKATVYFHMGGTPSSGTKSTALTYHAEDGKYYAAQHGGDYIDGNTGETISFNNVLVLKATTSFLTEKKLSIKTTGEGTGYFLSGGQMVPIHWSRPSVSKPFTFTLENGEPVVFAEGSTYIAVIPTDATVTFE